MKQPDYYQKKIERIAFDLNVSPELLKNELLPLIEEAGKEGIQFAISDADTLLKSGKIWQQAKITLMSKYDL